MTDSDDPAQEILTATYRALREHGYADLTLRDIAAESDRSKSSIHYHYDDSDDLLAAFVDDLYERYTTAIASVEEPTDQDRLRSLLGSLLSGTDERRLSEMYGIILELKAQAPYNDALGDGLRRFDAFLVGHVRDIVTDGIEAGEFREDVDPAREADVLTTLVEGERIRSTVVDRSDNRTDGTIAAYVETRLVVDTASNDSSTTEVTT